MRSPQTRLGGLSSTQKQTRFIWSKTFVYRSTSTICSQLVFDLGAVISFVICPVWSIHASDFKSISVLKALLVPATEARFENSVGLLLLLNSSKMHQERVGTLELPGVDVAYDHLMDRPVDCWMIYQGGVLSMSIINVLKCRPPSTMSSY